MVNRGRIRGAAAGLALVIGVGVGAPALAADANGDFFLRGLGNATCQTYLTEKANDTAAYYLFRSWANGYISAYNEMTPETYDILPDVTIGNVANGVESICRDRPEQNIWSAVAALTKMFEPDRLKVKSDVVTMSVGARSLTLYKETVRQVQAALAERGYDVGTPDGLFGGRTREALEAYQKAENLQVTGLPDLFTRARLLQ